MSGKVWILITAISFITHVYHVQSKCMYQDIRAHLDEMLLKEHVFYVKMFSPETEQHELLSVFNTLCAYWTNNKDNKNLNVTKTFRIMLINLQENFTEFCEKLNCTDAYTVDTIDTATFGKMYNSSCKGSVSDLECPSKSTPLTTTGPTSEFSTAISTTVSLVTTDNESITSLTTVVSTAPESITAAENLTADPRKETIIKDSIQWATPGLLVVSFLLNIILLFTVCCMYRKTKEQSGMEHEPQGSE